MWRGQVIHGEKTDLREAGVMACLLRPVPCDLRCRLRVTLQNWSCGAIISASFGAMTRETPLSILVCDRSSIRRSVLRPT